MDTPEKPKKKQGLVGVGLTLLIGGFCVLHQAGNTEAFYQNIGEQGSSVSWAHVIGWLMISIGGSLLLRGLASMLGGKTQGPQESARTIYRECCQCN